MVRRLSQGFASTYVQNLTNFHQHRITLIKNIFKTFLVKICLLATVRVGQSPSGTCPLLTATTFGDPTKVGRTFGFPITTGVSRVTCRQRVESSQVEQVSDSRRERKPNSSARRNAELCHQEHHYNNDNGVGRVVELQFHDSSKTHLDKVCQMRLAHLLLEPPSPAESCVRTKG